MGRRPQLRAPRGAPVPDHLRCTRSDGRQWRCPRRALGRVRFCRHHYLQSRRNTTKHKEAVDSASCPAHKRDPPPLQPPQPPSKRSRGKWGEAMMEELVRVAVRRRMEERERRRRRLAPAGEVTTRDLPNGVMAIASPGPVTGNVGPVVDRKLDFDGGSFLRRCFRSKNVDPAPIGPRKKFPCGRRGFERGARRVCHQCQEKMVPMTWCRECRKFFCSGCIKQWYHEMSVHEMKIACPICHGICSCKTCMPSRPKDDCQHEDITNSQNKSSKITYAHDLISELLPTPKRINLKKRIELEIQENNQGGRRFSGVQLKVAECRHDELLNCTCCGTSIAEFHRCCSRCSYKLCSSCCREICGRNNLGVATAHTFGDSNKRKAYKHVAKALNGINGEISSEQHPVMPFLYTPKVLSKQKHKRSGGRISCPTKVFGGYGDTILNLEIVLPLGSTVPLEDLE